MSEKIKIPRALSVDNVMNAKFKGLEFSGEWERVFGCPELGKTWFVWGQSGSGKTTGLMQLARYLSNFDNVIYNSLEQGLSKSIQDAYKRVGLRQQDGVFLIKENMSDFTTRMLRKRSPGIMVIDSEKYTRWRWSDYRDFCNKFPTKLKIIVGHAKGKEPKGALAEDIRYDADVKIYTEGYRMFVTSRYASGGENTMDIWAEGAREYWGETIE